MGLPKRSKSRVLSVEELLQESKEKQQSRLRYRSPQLPGFQIPSELPNLIPMESQTTPAWTNQITSKDNQDVQKAVDKQKTQQQKEKNKVFWEHPHNSVKNASDTEAKRNNSQQDSNSNTTKLVLWQSEGKVFNGK